MSSPDLRQGVTPTQHLLLDAFSDPRFVALFAQQDWTQLVDHARKLLVGIALEPTPEAGHTRIVSATLFLLAAAEKLAQSPAQH